MMRADEKLQKARCLLLYHEPWYGHAAMTMNWSEADWVRTMGVRIVNGGDVECLYNRRFVESLPVVELCGVIQHEIDHVIRCHCRRHGDRDQRVFNIATDMAVNGFRDNPRIGLWDPEAGRRIVPLGGRIIWIPEGWPGDASAEEYYAQLLRRRDLVEAGGVLDDHSTWNQTDVAPEEARQVVGSMIEGIKARGVAGPAHLRDALKQLVPPRINWRELLRRHLRRAINSRGWRNSHSRRPRRRDQFGLPGRLRRRGGRVSVIVDVSGSISDRELEVFFSELEEICQCAGTRISVLFWDTAPQGFVPDYRAGDWQSISLTGGGGTDMAAPFDWLVKNRLVGECVVLLTDGHCIWPSPQPFPLISVVLGDSVPEDGPGWGTLIPLNDYRDPFDDPT